MTKVCEICGKEFAVTKRNRGKKICSLACRTQKHRMATIRSDIKTALKELGLEAHGNQIASHYAHAKEKHPYFCDWVMSPFNGGWTPESIKENLERFRRHIQEDAEHGNVNALTLIVREERKFEEAMVLGDKARAIEELYDCVAVCLRTIDVLEGRQKLGKPETKGEMK